MNINKKLFQQWFLCQLYLRGFSANDHLKLKAHNATHYYKQLNRVMKKVLCKLCNPKNHHRHMRTLSMLEGTTSGYNVQYIEPLKFSLKFFNG